jgi:hypothetical protein
MSIFASLVTKILVVPDLPDHTITIRKLAPKHLEAAATAHQKASIEAVKEMGGPAFITELQALTGVKTAPKDQAEDGPAETVAGIKRDPTDGFDRVVLFRSAITGWTFDKDHTDEDVLTDIEGDVSDWLATEILTLAKPSLFSEDGPKND